MKKTSGSFLKISVYRRRFTGTVCSIIFILICFYDYLGHFLTGNRVVWPEGTLSVSGHNATLNNRADFPRKPVIGMNIGQSILNLIQV